MRKRILALALILAMFIFAIPGQAGAELPPHGLFSVGMNRYISTDNPPLTMDVAPFIENGRTYVPVRYLAYALGINDDGISWVKENNELFLRNDDYILAYIGKEGYTTGIQVVISPGSKLMFVSTNQHEIEARLITMDVAPVIRHNRIFLPARYVTEAFGGTIEWLPKSQSILIFPNDTQSPYNTPGYTPQPSLVDYDYLDFSWAYQGIPYYFQTGITGEMASEYLTVARKVPHPCSGPQDLLYYCSIKGEREFLAAVIDRFKETLTGMSTQEIAENVIAFVQELEYTSDGDFEYPRFPVETLLEKTGDCEDMAILTASMLRELNYDVALIVFEEHVGVGIAGEEGLPGYYFEVNGIKYYYLETTVEGWGVGDLIDDDKYMQAIVLPLP